MIYDDCENDLAMKMVDFSNKKGKGKKPVATISANPLLAENKKIRVEGWPRPLNPRNPGHFGHDDDAHHRWVAGVRRRQNIKIYKVNPGYYRK